MKLFVGNLNWDTTEEMLKSHFETAGDVSSVKIILDRETNRPRGFGFVAFSDQSDAHNAVQLLNNTQLDGRTIFVSEAKEQQPRSVKVEKTYRNPDSRY